MFLICSHRNERVKGAIRELASNAATSTGSGIVAYRFISDPEYFEEIVASVPRARRLTFTLPHLSPSERLLPVILAAEAADDDLGFEGLRYELPPLPLRWRPVQARQSAIRGRNVG